MYVPFQKKKLVSNNMLKLVPLLLQGRLYNCLSNEGTTL